MADSVYVSGVSCLSCCGTTTLDLLNAMQGLPQWHALAQLGRTGQDVKYGELGDFGLLLGRFVKPLQRRKLSRLSRMAVTAAGLALADAGLPKAAPSCGVVLGTGFGSTSQSELFYQDMLGSGFIKANPGLFPETVPNSPAGQVSLIFGMRGPNTTICQQSLSSELALMTAFDLIRDGKLQQVMVLGVEEMSSGLLSGLWGCGCLKKSQSLESVPLGKRLIPGEATVGMLLESARFSKMRQATPLAELVAVHSAGSARWPAAYTDMPGSIQRVLSLSAPKNVDCLIPSASFIREVDDSHIQGLAGHFSGATPLLMPEYHTGALFGAGLAKQALAVTLLNQEHFWGRKLGSAMPPLYESLYPDTFASISSVYTSSLSAGGGCAGTLLQRVS